MIIPTISMDFGGRPMEELDRLLERRRKWLRESAKDAAIATAVTALQSIRANTKTYRSGKVKVVYG